MAISQSRDNNRTRAPTGGHYTKGGDLLRGRHRIGGDGGAIGTRRSETHRRLGVLRVSRNDIGRRTRATGRHAYLAAIGIRARNVCTLCRLNRDNVGPTIDEAGNRDRAARSSCVGICAADRIMHSNAVASHCGTTGHCRRHEGDRQTAVA